MNVNAEVAVFNVAPLADPARGGRWCSVQIWADVGTPKVRQLFELKARLVTPEGSDATAEIDELVRAALAFVREYTLLPERSDGIILTGLTGPLVI